MKMKKMIALLLTFVMVFSLAACGSSDSSSSDETEAAETEAAETEAAETEAAETEADVSEAGDEEWGDIVWALNGSWNTLFPPAATSQYCVLVCGFLWEPLCALTSDGIVYRAAESIDVEDDGYTWYIKLREDLTWDDGEPCTADDWVFSLNMLTDPDFGVFNASGQMSIIAGTDDVGQRVDGEDFGVVYVDEYNFEIHFKQPMSMIAFCGTYSSHFKAYPKHILEDIPVDEISTSDFWSNPVGNGVCTFVDEPVAGQEVTFQAKEDFYMGTPSFNKLTIKVVDRSNAANALMNGEIDTFYPSLETSDMELLEEEADNLYIASYDYTGSWNAIFINNEKYDENVRKAIDLLIDKNLLVEALYNGKGYAIGDDCNPDASYYIPYEDTVDVEAAKALLDEAGWNYDDTIVVGVNEGSENAMIMIQQMCAEAGLKIELESGDATTFFAEFRAGERDAVYGSDTMNSTPVVKSSELQAGTNNMSHATNPRYFEICQEVAFCTDPDEETALYQEYQQLLRDECPMIYLFFIPAEIPLANHITSFDYGTYQPWNWVSLAE